MGFVKSANRIGDLSSLYMIPSIQEFLSFFKVSLMTKQYNYLVIGDGLQHKCLLLADAKSGNPASS